MSEVPSDDARLTEPLSDEEVDALFQELTPFLGAEFANASVEVCRVADWQPSALAAQPFVEFTEWITTRPAFIARWRSKPETEAREYTRFVKVTDDARSAYAAACYHLQNIIRMETAINGILAGYKLSRNIPFGTGVGMTGTRRIDFEYHAFVLCCRRSLDYMAWGLSAFFGRREGSFREFGKKLQKWKPESVSLALKEVCDRNAPNFKFIMDAERGRSTRDRISHYEFVQAGVINIHHDGHRFLGGGEQIAFGEPNDMNSLSELLKSRVIHLHRCISELLEAFRAAVTNHEANSDA